MNNYNYKIVAFACLKWGYSAADLAGVSRLKYPSSIKIIKVRCTGRVDLKHILYSMKSGADGVMVVGWRPNECQFKNGNFTAQRHVELANRILESRGFGNQRINMYWLSGAEAEKFVKSVEDTIEKVKTFGPSPLNLIANGSELETEETKQVINTPVEWIL